MTKEVKHLVAKYFDHYLEDEKYFDTEEKAKEFAKEMNKKLRNRYKTYWEYRGAVE